MSEVKKLLDEIGAELGRTEAQMKPFVDTLEGQWYDTISSLKDISDAQWDKLGLPARLVDAIKLRTKGEPSMSAPGAQPIAHAHTSSASSASPTEGLPQQGYLRLSSIDLAPPPNDTLPQSMDELAAIVATSVPPESMEKAILTLVKLTDSILANPEEEKTRRIRQANPSFHERCGQYRSCIKFLLALGFEEQGEFLVMQNAFLSRLTDGRKGLEHVAKEARISLPPMPGRFNPYVASHTAMSVQPATMNDKRLAEMEEVKLKLERKRRELANQGDKTNTLAPPRVFWQASQVRLEDAVKRLEQQIAAEADEEGDNLLLQDTLRCMQSSNANKFHSREKSELQQLTKTKVYEVAILRVIMPNQIVLELNFKPKTKWQEVYEVVEQCLSDDARFVEWFLYATPPIQKFSRNNETLLSTKLVPGAVVFLGVDNRERDIPRLGQCVRKNLYSSLPPFPVKPTIPSPPDSPPRPKGSGSGASSLLQKLQKKKKDKH